MTPYKEAENLFRSRVTCEAVLPYVRRGCVLGLSGGADSALLLVLAARVLKEEGIPLLALHVHHGIRAEEAERDLAFSMTLARTYGVPFEARRVDVPAIAEESGESVEEAARRVRYDTLLSACSEHGYGVVLTAHHATDSVETVLLNLIRGTGSAGLCGIPSVRQVGEALILRPLLSLSQSDVLAAVAAEGIPYVTDSTNADTKYRRNYIRRELIPRILSVNPAFERSVGRMSESLREDVDFLQSEAQDRFCRIKRENGVLRDALLALHAAMRYRVVVLLYRQTHPNAPMPERVHIDALLRRLQEGGTFRLAFPGGVEAVAEGEILTFKRRAEDFLHPETPLSMGETVLADGARIFLLEKPVCPPYANVYKLSIHRDLASATINGGLYVRSRQEGDAYRFGGVTHKLKKLFSDAKIPLEERSHIPVVLDGEGILWVAGFGVRDDGARNGEEKDLTLYYLPRDAAAKIQRGDI